MLGQNSRIDQREAGLLEHIIARADVPLTFLVSGKTLGGCSPFVEDRIDLAPGQRDFA